MDDSRNLNKPKHTSEVPPQSIAQVFNCALGNYLDISRRRAYSYDQDFPSATYGLLFTKAEQDFFLRAYNTLWDLGGKIEAYTLLRLVFGNLRTDILLGLLDQNRLLTLSHLKRRGRHD